MGFFQLNTPKDMLEKAKRELTRLENADFDIGRPSLALPSEGNGMYWKFDWFWGLPLLVITVVFHVGARVHRSLRLQTRLVVKAFNPDENDPGSIERSFDKCGMGRGSAAALWAAALGLGLPCPLSADLGR
jgi:hypothetical protein